MARRTSPGDKPSQDAAVGLSEAYRSLRESTRQLATELGVSPQEFDAELPVLDVPEAMTTPSPEAFFGLASHAGVAATRLNLLAGYLEGLVETSLLTEDLGADQVARVRGALG